MRSRDLDPWKLNSRLRCKPAMASWRNARLAPAHESHNNQTKDSQESCAPAMAMGREWFFGVFFFHLSMANVSRRLICFLPICALCISVM